LRQQFPDGFVENAAAELFWTFASIHGVSNAFDNVKTSGGGCLFEDMDLVKKIFFDPPLSIQKGQDEKFVEAFRLVTAEIMKYVKRDENIQGAFWEEDASAGRSLSAWDIKTNNLTPPKSCSIDPSGHPSLLQTGTLLIRHPLPAVVLVLSKKAPNCPIIQVANTKLALGFDYPMFLQVDSVRPFLAGQFVLTGIFHIPVKNGQQGKSWDGVIQNSSHFMHLRFSGENPISITAQW